MDNAAAAPFIAECNTDPAMHPPPETPAGARVTAVSACATHRFSKENRLCVRLLAGLGVEGDAHLGVTVKHRSRVAKDPGQPNLRQVHLITEETLANLRGAGFEVAPGQLGENLTTRGIDLLGLPEGTRLRLGGGAVVRITGLRNPCVQLDRFRPGLMRALIGRDAEGRPRLLAGVMGVVLAGGEVVPGDAIDVLYPPPPYRRLERV